MCLIVPRTDGNSRISDREEQTSNRDSRKGRAPQRLESRDTGDELLKGR